MNEEKFLEAVEKVTVPARYCIRADELCALYEATSGDFSRSVLYAFRYGFIKGQRAAKAKKREGGDQHG